MRNQLTKFLKSHRQDFLAAATIAAVYIVLFSLKITCPIKFLTGISCPGCGMTRACLCALKFDFVSAFAYHPLWPFLPISAFLLILFTVKGNKKAVAVVVYVFAGAMLIVYLVRIFHCNGDVVVFAPKNGFIYQVVQKVLSFILE